MSTQDTKAIMDEIVLPWPDRALHPNARVHWSDDENDALCAAVEAGAGWKEIAAVAGRSARAVQSHAFVLGLLGSRVWTESEVAILCDRYSRVPLNSAGIARELGRSIDAVEIKAGRLGLANPRRPKKRPQDRRPRRKFGTAEALHEHMSAVRRAWIEAHGHPRGFAGHVHSAASRAAIAAKSRAAWRDQDSGLHSEHASQMRSDSIMRNIRSGKMRSGYSRCRGGRRADLGDRYFRSAWEANYARFLNFLVSHGEIDGWDYECKTFEFDKIKRGTRSYTPDFLVKFKDGRHEWHEVKGWMDQRSKTRLARMARYFPTERVVVIGEAWFRDARRKIAPMIEGWEDGTVHARDEVRKPGEVRIRIYGTPA